MALNLQSNADYSSLHKLTSKISCSQGTDASDQLVFGRHLSLISCASSLSIQENGQLQTANQLFAHYLFAKQERDRKMHLQKMKIHFNELQKTEPDRIQTLSMLQFQSSDEEGRILSHFIACWLLFMGYGSSKNRRYFITRIKLMTAQTKVHKFAKIYNNLSLLGLSSRKLLQFLLQTCKNGWQYFIREVVRLESNTQVKVQL